MFCAHLHSNYHQKGAVNIFGAIFVDCVKIEDDDSAAASKTTAKQCVPDFGARRRTNVWPYPCVLMMIIIIVCTFQYSGAPF